MKQQSRRAGADKPKAGRPKSAARRESFTVRLTPAHREKLDRLAERKGTTPGALVQIAVAELLEKEAQ